MNFCVSFLPWIWHPSNIFVRNLSFLLSCLLFNENLPRKFPQKSREISRFLHEFVSSNPVKLHFFSRELSEALVYSVLYCANLKSMNSRFFSEMLLCCEEKANQMQDEKTASCNGNQLCGLQFFDLLSDSGHCTIKMSKSNQHVNSRFLDSHSKTGDQHMQYYILQRMESCHMCHRIPRSKLRLYVLQ